MPLPSRSQSALCLHPTHQASYLPLTGANRSTSLTGWPPSKRDKGFLTIFSSHPHITESVGLASCCPLSLSFSSWKKPRTAYCWHSKPPKIAYPLSSWQQTLLLCPLKGTVLNWQNLANSRIQPLLWTFLSPHCFKKNMGMLWGHCFPYTVKWTLLSLPQPRWC